MNATQYNHYLRTRFFQACRALWRAMRATPGSPNSNIAKAQERVKEADTAFRTGWTAEGN